jgi:hypothetical protein
MNYDLPEPNEKLINEYLLKFSVDKRYSTADKAIEKLIKIFPHNICIKEIQLKISVINDLYSTNIFSTFKLAEHIHSLKIDIALSKKDYSIVHKIAVGHSIKSKKTTNDYNFYSFATKYCSWHMRATFPIYDKYIDSIIKIYNKNYKYEKTIDLKKYENLVSIIDKFKIFHNLNNNSITEIDKFLWYLGKETVK